MPESRVEVSRGPGLASGFTTRWGGVSRLPYDDYNLATHVGDDPAAVTENRQRLHIEIGAPVVWMDQVHGDRVAHVAQPSEDDLPGTDALVTSTPGLALAVLVADCVPVVLTDVGAGVVGVAHVGRRGLVAGVAVKTAEAMYDLGARRGALTADLGPAICGACYEVPAVMRDDVERAVPGSAATTSAGTPSIDIKAGLRTQLADAARIRDTGICTAESADHFSHRRDGVTGRFAGFVTIRS